jgi:hypothetical protein
MGKMRDGSRGIGAVSTRSLAVRRVLMLVMARDAV